MNAKHLIVVFGFAFLGQPAFAQTFTLCEGEYRQDHPNNRCTKPFEVYAYCQAALEIATNICKELGSDREPKLVLMSETGGNKCGYRSYRVICK